MLPGRDGLSILRVLNLLDNATKYNIESGAISVSLTKSGSLAIFRIANTGQEIPRDRETRIFERFYRANPSRTFDVVGSGLGLSICREIALAHGGHIWSKRNEPGRTAFVLALPGPPSSRIAQIFVTPVLNGNDLSIDIATGANVVAQQSD